MTHAARTRVPSYYVINHLDLQCSTCPFRVGFNDTPQYAARRVQMGRVAAIHDDDGSRLDRIIGCMDRPIIDRSTGG